MITNKKVSLQILLKNDVELKYYQFRSTVKIGDHSLYIQKTSNYKKRFFCFPSIRMLNLTLNELKLVAKSRGVKDYENKSEDDLMKILTEPKTKTSLSKKKIGDIRKDFNKSRYKFSKSKIKDIRRNLYNIKNPKNLSKSKIKETEKNLYELENSLTKLKSVMIIMTSNTKE